MNHSRRNMNGENGTAIAHFRNRSSERNLSTLKRVKFGTVGRENNIIVIEKNFMK